MATRKIRSNSRQSELLVKSREAMLSAIQIFNNPNTKFKSEAFIVLAVISWTYLLHAYYRHNKIEYRHRRKDSVHFVRTAKGAYKFWELETCLNESRSPVGKIPAANLRFLIGIRHEIEHQMTKRLDDFLSGKLQACCLNYNSCIKALFGDLYGIENHLSVSLQLSGINEDQEQQLRTISELPKNIQAYIAAFEVGISEDDYSNPQFSYGVYYVKKLVNHKGQANSVIEFIPANSEAAQGLHKHQVAFKDREKQKFLPTHVVAQMQTEGFETFTMHSHTCLWQELKAKEGDQNGCNVHNQWYWYQHWIDTVRAHCLDNKQLYGFTVSL